MTRATPLLAVLLALLPITLAPPPAAATTNLLVNPSFEDDLDGDDLPDGWTPLGVTVARVPAPTHHGAYAVDLLPNASQPVRALASTPVPVAPGERYQVDGWAFGPNRALLSVHFASPAQPANLTAAWTMGTAVTWTSTAFEVVVPYGASAMQVVVHATAFYGAVVDDLRVTRLADLGERLANGRFEVGVGTEPDGWDLSCTTGFTSWQQASGASGRTVSLTTTANGSSCRIDHAATGAMYAAVQPERTYRFSFDYHAAADLDGAFHLTFHVPGSGATTHTGLLPFLIPPGTAVWRTTWLDACAPPGAAFANVSLVQETRSTGSAARWDNLSVRDTGPC